MSVSIESSYNSNVGAWVPEVVVISVVSLRVSGDRFDGGE